MRAHSNFAVSSRTSNPATNVRIRVVDYAFDGAAAPVPFTVGRDALKALCLPTNTNSRGSIDGAAAEDSLHERDEGGPGLRAADGQPEISNPAVVGSAMTPPQKGSGQTVTTTFRLVQEVDALQEALGLSAAVSGGYAGFSGSAKMEFAQQCAVTQSACMSFWQWR